MPGLFTLVLPMLFRITFRTLREVADVRRAHAKAVITTLAVCGATRSHQRHKGRCYVRCILKEAVFLLKPQKNQFAHSLHTDGPSGLNSDTQDACKTPRSCTNSGADSASSRELFYLKCFLYKRTQLTPLWRGQLAGHAWQS
jgi:hypothetical protein